MSEPSRKKKKHFNSDEKGVALLLVLFVVTLLLVIAAEFTFTTRTELSTARYFKDDVEGYYYALAGFQYAVTEIIGKYDDTYLGDDGQVGFLRKWKEEENSRSKDGEAVEEVAWPPLPNRSGIPIGDGAFDYIITDEEGRLNLNFLGARNRTGQKNNREIFRELLIATGVEDGEQADIIIDSILDWVDRNDEHRLNGAESDWYEKNYKEQGFSEPYQCKNGRIDTIDELLMIRGMTPEILYGSDSIFAKNNETQYSGILPYITVYGFNRKVNLRTAPPLLLQIINPDRAQQMDEERRDPTKRKRKKPSRTFRIEVRGYRNSGDIGHTIMAVVRRSYRRKTGGGIEIYYWDDEALSFGSNLSVYNTWDEGSPGMSE